MKDVITSQVLPRILEGAVLGVILGLALYEVTMIQVSIYDYISADKLRVFFENPASNYLNYCTSVPGCSRIV
jgi:hypothetical protein